MHLIVTTCAHCLPSLLMENSLLHWGRGADTRLSVGIGSPRCPPSGERSHPSGLAMMALRQHARCTCNMRDARIKDPMNASFTVDHRVFRTWRTNRIAVLTAIGFGSLSRTVKCFARARKPNFVPWYFRTAAVTCACRAFVVACFASVDRRPFAFTLPCWFLRVDRVNLASSPFCKRSQTRSLSNSKYAKMTLRWKAST